MSFYRGWAVLLAALLVFSTAGCLQSTSSPTDRATSSNRNSPATRTIRPPAEWPQIADRNIGSARPASELAADKVATAPSALGQEVTCIGSVVRVQPTSARDALNVHLAPAETGLMLWIDRTSKPALEAAFGGDLAWLLPGREVLVRGTLAPYGGYRTEWKERRQIAITAPEQLKLVTHDGKSSANETLLAAAEPPQAQQPSTPPAPTGPVIPYVAPPSSELAQPLPPGGVKLLAWNLQSGQSGPSVIAKELADFPDVSLYALSEVDSLAFDRYLTAVEAIDDRNFCEVHGASGAEDRLQLIYDADRFELLETNEPNQLADITVNPGNYRSPLINLLRDRTTDQRFYVVLVHLARGDEALRNEQGRALREWARQQSIAVIAVGDFNYDFKIDTERGNETFTELTRDNILHWVRPEKLIESNWTDENHDGAQDYPNSLLDGAFVAGPATEWRPASRVLVRDADFPDDDCTSDHRPVELVFVPE